jgi:hypothetical protein
MEKRFKDLSDTEQWEMAANLIGDYWHDPIIEHHIEKLEELGFDDPKIEYSGFWSRGDGASFTSKSLDLQVFLKKYRNMILDQCPDADEDKLKVYHEEGMIDLGIVSSADVIPFLAMDAIESGDIHTYITVRRTSNHYVHENSCSVNLEADNIGEYEDAESSDWDTMDLMKSDAQLVWDFLTWLERWLDSWVIEYNREIYNELETTYDKLKDANYEKLMNEEVI